MPVRNAEPPADVPGRLPGWQPGRLLTEWLVVGGLLSLLLTALVLTGAARRFDQVLYDYVLVTRPPPPPGDIIIIGIDETSLAQLGPWPWPRRFHAEAIARISAAGARAIGYDVLFTEPRPGDAVLSAALNGRVPVVLPTQFRVPGSNGRGYDAVPPVVGGTAARVGHASVHLEEDGVVRTLDLAMDGSERRWHVAALLAGVDGGLPAFVAAEAGAPLVRRGERLVGFRGGPGRFRSVPFAALLAGEVPPELLAGRIVLVGATAAGLGDQFSTPTAGATAEMPGVEMQASFIADLIQGRHLRRAGRGWSIGLGLVALWLGMAALLRLQPAAAAMYGAALTVMTAVGAALVFRQTGLWIGPGAALAVLLLAQPVWAWRRLAVVNDGMLTVLAALGRQPGMAAVAAGTAAADPVTRDPVTKTTELLEAMIERVESLRELANAALRGLPDATLLVDRGGGIVAANGAAAALFGQAPTLASVDAAMNAGLPGFGTATLADPNSAWRGEHGARDGSIRDIRFTPWRDAQGAPLGWIVRFADISALRRAEMAREEALQLLTHDMRAPQATILALLDRHPELDADLAARLRQLATRTVALADGYLQLARADAGDYAMTEVDLAAIVTEAVDELWPQSQAKDVRLVGEQLDDEALLTGNYQLLLRAAVNLIGNAVKFAPQGSVVTARVGAAAGGWRFDVIDTGPGLTGAEQARLFGRFRTGPKAGAGSDGVGLGLAFVRAVADGHGGTITCTSTAGAGAKFSLWLPLMLAAPLTGVAPPALH
ncbi:histidine kinase [Polymorphobacter glacialis]|uniref:histidine kinase n=1 Tax=Sandarakinorhabdus glacialis TaxID=1614636 RepID=A0A916ZZN5_9SPHN|nr:CHASE2 domain-containing protein [Polymorphobacter glacialis]GGE19100.1 histidine kinase [Polymorphobacter glacialis]